MENLSKGSSVSANNKSSMDINSGGDFMRNNSNDNFNLKHKESSKCCGIYSTYGGQSNEQNNNILKPIPSHHLMVYERASLLFDDMQNTMKTWPTPNCNGNIGDGTLMDRNNWIHSNRIHLNPQRCYNSNCCLNACNNVCQCNDYPHYYGAGQSNSDKYSEERIKNFIAKYDDDEESKSKLYGIVYASFILITCINWLTNFIEDSLENMKIKIGKFLNSTWNICDSSAETKNNKSIQYGLILLSPLLMIIGGLYSLICVVISFLNIINGQVPSKLMKVFNLKCLLNTVE